MTARLTDAEITDIIAGSPRNATLETIPAPNLERSLALEVRELRARVVELEGERNRALAELGEIIVSATIRPGEEFCGRPGPACDAVRSVLAERDSLFNQLQRRRSKRREGAEGDCG